MNYFNQNGGTPLLPIVLALAIILVVLLNLYTLIIY